eukprot:TRINITY_DN3586_c0_g1_i6.p2 TRINITY_DN3586_c0_g1~~TRINITY_DN3586_c0_g1_i6.p2  ORF type:complete len:103 (+),score=15.53 TRINITY_DN3586_c0_g1_i6:25-309(+)
MIRRPPRSTRKESSAASDVYKRQRFFDDHSLLCLCRDRVSIGLFRRCSTEQLQCDLYFCCTLHTSARQPGSLCQTLSPSLSASSLCFGFTSFSW